MMVYWLIAFLLVILYYIWIGIFYYGWVKTPSFDPGRASSKSFVSIIVPVRNEEFNILWLLKDLTSQEYPQNMLEIIIADDHSTDLTSDIAEYFAGRHGNIRYVKLGSDEEGKKSALQKGILLSRYPLILTTDADCRIPPLWVGSMVEYFDKTGSDLVAGPVIMKGDTGFLGRFQQLEFFSLLGSTAGAIKSGNPVMCNSANLGFRKDVWLETRDPASEVVSSGDDVFLLLAISKSHGKKIAFLKARNATVITRVQPEIDEFLKQRKRWTSKSRHYKARAPVFTALLIFILHFYCLVCLFAGLMFQGFLLIAASIFIAKSLIDFPFLWSVTGHFRKRKLMRYFLPVQALYFFYISYTVLTAFNGVFDWKGRFIRH